MWTVFNDIRDSKRRISERVKSRPADPDQVAARILNVLPHRETLSRSPSPPSSTPSTPVTLPGLTEEEQYQEDLQVETDAYNALVKAGGRPQYPLELLEDVSKNPEEYRELLSHWQFGNHPNDWKVFLTQLARWLGFGRLQKFARGQNADDYWEDVRQDGRRLRGFGNHPIVFDDKWENVDIRPLFAKEGDGIVSFNGTHWNWKAFVGRRGSGTEQYRFPEYAKALKERLAKHGFIRPFQLNEDLTRQDKLTTWIEYLGYEYWWYDQFAPSKSGEQRYKEAWKKLVDSVVLRSFETEEYICDIDSAFQRASEREIAERAVESAKSAVMWFQKAVSAPQRSDHASQEHQQRQREAKTKLDAAIQEHDSIKRRNDLITGFLQLTRNYRIAKRNAERHGVLLRWMLQQVPLIELELNSPNVAEKDLNREDGSKRQLERSPADDSSEEQGATSQSYDDGQGHRISGSETCTVFASPGGERCKRRSHDIDGDERPSKRLRHTSQIQGKTSDSATAIPPLGVLQDAGTALAKSMRKKMELAMEKTAPLTNKRGRGMKAGSHSNSLRRSKNAPIDIAQSSTVTEAPIPHRRPKRSKPRSRQRKAYKKERASRRLAGVSPELDMLPDRGNTPPLYKTLRKSSSTCKPNSSSTHGNALLKKLTTVEGAKPQGISRSRQAKTNRSKR